MYIYICIHVHVYMYVCIYVSMYVCMYVCMYVYICIHIVSIGYHSYTLLTKPLATTKSRRSTNLTY